MIDYPIDDGDIPECRQSDRGHTLVGDEPDESVRAGVRQMVNAVSKPALFVDSRNRIDTFNAMAGKLLPALAEHREFELHALLHESPLATPVAYRVDSDIDAVLVNGITVERQISVAHDSGKPCSLHLQMMACHSEHGDVEGVLVLFTDDSLAREQERKVHEANEELTQLHHHLSHDLTAPINSIGGLLQMIKGEFEEGELAEIPELLQESESQVVRLRALISDLMSLAQSGANEPTMTRFDFRELVQDISELLSGNSRTMELSISAECSVDTMESDRIRVKQILTNLISNARKFQDPDEVAPEIVVLLNEDEHGVELIVRDNGLGIAESRKDSLFDLFVRGNTAGQPGHGLGLYIVRKHVAKLGGSVEISNCRKPTEFTVHLPRTR